MATYDVFSTYIYTATDSGSGNALIATEDGNGTLNDVEGDTVFDLGPPADSFTFTVDFGLGPTAIVGEYAGYLNSFDGETVPVIFVPQANIPALYQSTFPDGVYVVSSTRDEIDVTPPNPVDFSTDLIIADFDTICFLPGTAIATPSGETPVEALQIGDPILTADGRAVPVKWVGVQTVMTRFGPAERLMPVRVAAGALGGGLPRRNLTLTTDHALLIDRLLVNAGALVNGTTITRVPLGEFGERYTLYHVETEAHDVILAEGTPAETYIDYVGRQAFDNHAEYLDLYGEDRTIPENPVPRISAARMLPAALKRRLGITRAA